MKRENDVGLSKPNNAMNCIEFVVSKKGIIQLFYCNVVNKERIRNYFKRLTRIRFNDRNISSRYTNNVLRGNRF